MLGGRLPPVDAVDVCPDRLRVPSAGAPPSAGRSPHRKPVGPTPPHVRPPPPPPGSVPRSSAAAAIARSRSVRIATPSSAVRRCGIVISWNTCDKNRIAQHSAGHLDRWSGSPDAPPTLWATRGIEHDRFRSADGRDDRSVLIAAGNARRTVALIDALDASPHSGPGRSLVSGRPPSQRNADVCGSEIPEADQSGNGRGLDGSAGAWCSGDVDRSQS